MYTHTHIKGWTLTELSDIMGHCLVAAQSRVLFWILTQPFFGLWGCCSSPSTLQIPFWVKSAGLSGQYRDLIYLLEPNKAFRFWSCSSPYLDKFLFLQWIGGWDSPHVQHHRLSFPIALCVVSVLWVVKWMKESEDLGLPGDLVWLGVQCQMANVTAVFMSCRTGFRELMEGNVQNEVAGAFLQGSALTGLGT